MLAEYTYKKKKKTLLTLKCFIKFEFSNGFCPLNLKRIRLNKRQRKIVDFFLLLFLIAKKGAFYASAYSSIKHSKTLNFRPFLFFSLKCVRRGKKKLSTFNSVSVFYNLNDLLIQTRIKVFPE